MHAMYMTLVPLKGSPIRRLVSFINGGTRLHVIVMLTPMSEYRDAKVDGAIFNGLYGLGAPIPFTCPTGNCAWSDHTTLAIKGSCINVTAATTVVCTDD